MKNRWDVAYVSKRSKDGVFGSAFVTVTKGENDFLFFVEVELFPLNEVDAFVEVLTSQVVLRPSELVEAMPKHVVSSYRVEILADLWQG